MQPVWDDDTVSDNPTPAEQQMPGEADQPESAPTADRARPRRQIDPATAASVAAGAAWLAGKGVHRVRKRRAKTRGGARTKVGGHVSNVGWTIAAAAAAAIVEVLVGRLLKRNRGR